MLRRFRARGCAVVVVRVEDVAPSGMHLRPLPSVKRKAAGKVRSYGSNPIHRREADGVLSNFERESRREGGLEFIMMADENDSGTGCQE
jgi:hypothetical protein